MDPLYEPKAVEERWQRVWEEEGLYDAEPDSDRESFVIMHPPPNISGSLTIGHVLQLSLEDTLVRWHRMRGFDTLFQPGYDHAGISTWAAIGRTLAKEGRSQRDLGREGFDSYVQDWLTRYGGTIMAQFRRVGASLDYARTRFTMDDDYYRAVIRWFVHLYRRGWIYRDNRISNWCPRDRTALSDLELEPEDVDDTLSYIRYPLADGSGHVTIATVRPATIVADVVPELSEELSGRHQHRLAFRVHGDIHRRSRRHGDAKAWRRLGHRLREGPLGWVRPPRISGLVPCEDVEQMGSVRDGAGERACSREPLERRERSARHAPARGL